MSDKRFLFLQDLVQKGSKDPMAFYGLAMEYRTRAQVDDALRTFVELREIKPDYVAMYLMCGQMLAEADRKPEARTWLDEGVSWAKKTNSTHALGELETAIETLGGA